MIMSHEDLVLPTPERFPAFPYDPPYSIQTDIMKHVYSSIEQKHVTIVESPTGTGKTLSLLCSSLSWITDERERARKGQIAQEARTGKIQPAWVSAQTAQIRQRELEAQDREYEERIAKARKAEARLRALANAKITKRQRVPAKSLQAPDDRGEELYLPDREMDEPEDNISPAVRELMAKLNNTTSNHERVDTQEPTCTKVYYTSRTHSQLTQVIPELRKLKFKHVSYIIHHPSQGPSNEDCSISSGQTKKRSLEVDEEEHAGTDRRQWRTVSLGSRKQLCINEDIRSKPGDLDEKCRDLQDGRKERRCLYLPPSEDQVRLIDLRDQILASPKDIEDLATAGKNAQTCPYYGSRKAIPQAELVTLPYNLLLQKSAREALGIDLSNQIVIIDEAHNLIPTLLSLSSVRVTSHILSTSLNQVMTYYEKFRTRLSAQHSLHLKRLISYMEAIQKITDEWKATKSEAGSTADVRTEVFTIPNIVEKLGRKAAGINLLEIEAYLKKSKIARKISGYAEAVSGGEGRSRLLSPSRFQGTPPLHAIEALMVGLVGAREDGRIILSLVGDRTHQEEVEIKYQLLNPSTTFREVVESARSVVLAGGTMSPMSDIIVQLFPWLPSERLSTFSCGHIVPRSHVQTLCVTKGPAGSLLEFKYAQQTDQRLLVELGQLILNLCSVVPGGMVVFFPSYSALNLAQKAWNTTQHMIKFGAKKTVFLEPQDSNGVESTLRQFADAVKTLVRLKNASRSIDVSDKRTGAILFAVVGGKLSEGLNFSDELARAVIVIGLPFANKNSPELQERMRYANEVEKKLGTKRHPGSKDAASELYENMCMSAVNQSIGRAIRHRTDWASLILVDRRYCSASIQNKLPAWIRDGVSVCDGFGQTMKQLSQFYRERKQSGPVATDSSNASRIMMEALSPAGCYRD
ncbi:Helicase C-terminal domain containing protein [Tylopilus felleus]